VVAAAPRSPVADLAVPGLLAARCLPRVRRCTGAWTQVPFNHDIGLTILLGIGCLLCFACATCANYVATNCLLRQTGPGERRLHLAKIALFALFMATSGVYGAILDLALLQAEMASITASATFYAITAIALAVTFGLTYRIAALGRLPQPPTKA